MDIAKKPKLVKSSSIPILGMLTWRSMTGYEIRREIQGSLGNFWSESFGQIYPQLRSLSEAGLIEIVPGEQSAGKVKNTYAITDAGRGVLRDWISNTPTSRPPRNELLLKVFFASEGDWQAVRDHCRKAREDAVARLRKYQIIEQQIDTVKDHQDKAKYWRMTLRMGLAEARTFITWCDETLVEFAEVEQKKGVGK